MELQGARIAVLGGKRGMLGQALCRALEAAQATPLALSSGDFNPLDEKALVRFLDQEQPVAVINAVAHTQVDQAEDEPEAAYALNRDLPALLGKVLAPRGLPLAHFSTDFVFSGRRERPWTEEDEPRPMSVYGKSKLAGEEALLDAYRSHSGARALVLRTAWLFGPGKTNFVHKILTLARERDKLTVVHDQVGSPTYAPDLAKMALDLLRLDAHGLLPTGIYHAVNSGRASWCELAAEAVSAAGLHCRVEPVPSSAYPTRAVRPAYSVLDTAKLAQATGKTPRPWVAGLRDYLFQDLAGEF